MRENITHFAAAGTVEMLFDEPLPCPQYAALTFDGLAGTPDGHTHLIIRIGTVRAHLGPDADTIGRRALILLASLANSPTPPRPSTGPAILSWLSECWSTTRTALANETAQTLTSAAEASNPPRACTCGHSIDDHADDPYDDSCDLCDCDELGAGALCGIAAQPAGGVPAQPRAGRVQAVAPTGRLAGIRVYGIICRKTLFESC